jgi:hypothetical protein
MGIDIDSKMIVGVRADEINVDGTQCPMEYAEIHELDYASEWFDADTDGIIIGIQVQNHVWESGLEAFMVEVKDAMNEMRKHTSVEPLLIGMQHVW